MDYFATETEGPTISTVKGPSPSADSRRPLALYYETTMVNLEALSVELSRLTDLLSPILYDSPVLASSGDKRDTRTELESKFESINYVINTAVERIQYLANNVVL